MSPYQLRSSKKNFEKQKLIKKNLCIKSLEKICPICLNNIEDQSFCSGCSHTFCFSCVKQWSNSSTNCPICRNNFNSIIYNLNTDLDVYKLKKKDKRVTNNKSSKKFKKEPFFVLEVDNEDIIGLEVLDKYQKTSNIIQVNEGELPNSLPEISITNITKNENGIKFITRHKYDLKELSISEQNLLKNIISSATSLSFKEHQETRATVYGKLFTSILEKQSLIDPSLEKKNLLADIYTINN